MKQLIDRFLSAVRRKRDVSFWYHPSYECPTIMKHNKVHGVVHDRGKKLLSHLLHEKLIDMTDIHPSPWVGLSVLGLFHSRDYLESLESPQTLGRIFGLKPQYVDIDELVGFQRRGVGGTIMAIKSVLQGGKKVAINLGGGFHHAEPDKGSGFCAYNDIAVAIAKLRKQGYQEPVAIVDLDFHFGNGNTAAFAKDPSVLVYSINGPQWSQVRKKKTEITLPEETTDREYLKKLRETFPKVLKTFQPRLMFYVAGHDVLSDDPLGGFEMTVPGVFERDRLVVDWARENHVPLVVTLAGGFSMKACQCSANLLSYTLGATEKVDLKEDTNFHKSFGHISKSLNALELQKEAAVGNEFSFSAEDLFDSNPLGSQRKILDFYSAYGIELALERYGILPKIRKLGYCDLKISVNAAEPMHQIIRVEGRWEADPVPKTYLLGEVVLRKLALPKPKEISGGGKLDLISIEWLLLQHPMGSFSDKKKILPGQEHPGLGLGMEVQEVFVQMALRLGMDGLALHPSHYHIGLGASALFHFLDPKVEGRFRALREILKKKELAAASFCVEKKRLQLRDGEVISWVPGDQIHAVSDRLKAYFNSPDYEENVLQEKYRLLKEGLHIAREPKRLRKAAPRRRAGKLAS
ncbi:MAG: histone deacetylase [Deltaproteobacteria bacterium]|nr:histone deacetylase [Deltaproteobacteria bacterium]